MPSRFRQQPEKPRYIKLHDDDNVAIVVNSGGLPAGSVFDDGLTLREHVPQGHKVALTDIAKDGMIKRYGEVIGHAGSDIAKGSWIDETLVRLPEAPALATLPLATGESVPLPPLDGYTFEGYRNADGSGRHQEHPCHQHQCAMRGGGGRLCRTPYQRKAAAQVP